MKEKSWDAFWMILLSAYICASQILVADRKGVSAGELLSMWPVWVAYGNITLSLIISILYMPDFRQKFLMIFPLLLLTDNAFDPKTNKWTVWLITFYVLVRCYMAISSSRRDTQSTDQEQSNPGAELTE